MAARQQKGKSEASEIVGAISKFAGALVGTATVTSKKIAGFRSGAAEREKVLIARVALLESKLAATRRELEKVRSGEKGSESKQKAEGKKSEKKKIKKKTKKAKKAKKSSRPQNRPKYKVGTGTNVARKSQKAPPLAAGKTATSTSSAS